MADLAGDPYGYDSPSRGGWARQAAMAAGAAAALGLAFGLVSWGHGLLTRDAGLVPFLRAEDGPMKIVPEDPGGIKLERTDLAVTSILSGRKSDSTAYAPAPERPEDEDLAQPYLKPPASPGVDGRVVAGAPAPAQSSAAGQAAIPPAPTVEGGADAIQAALARASAEATAAATASSAEAVPGAADASPQAPSAMPLAPARPRPPAPGTRVASAAPSAASAPAATTPAATPAAAPASTPSGAGIGTGDVVIQLGAFNSADIAESQWRRALRRNEDLIGAYGHAVTTVESGGRTLFRLRVGPMADRTRAQDLCAALKARGDACIVAKVR